MVFTLFRIYWAMPNIVVEFLACWQGNFSRHRNGVIWMAVPYCLMCCIWWERNNRCFEDSERTIAFLTYQKKRKKLVMEFIFWKSYH